MNITLMRADEARTLTALNEKYIAKKILIEQINEAIEDAVYETGIAEWCMTPDTRKWLEDYGYIVTEHEEEYSVHRYYKISWR